MPEEIITEKNKKNKEQHSGEAKSKMVREEDTWIFAT